MVDFYIDLSIGTTSATIGESGFPFTYDGIYVVKSIVIIVITFAVVIFDIKSFTLFTTVIMIGFATFFLALLTYIIENAFYIGRGSFSFVDNDGVRLYMVIFVCSGVAIAIKMIINVLQVEYFPTQVDKILKEMKKKG